MERLKSIFEKLYMENPYIGVPCFIDLETTGLKNGSKIIEIGAIKVIFDGIDLKFDTYETLINPDMMIDQIITDITGITNEELKSAPSEADVYPQFVNWFFENKMPNFCVAHNAAFDQRQLKSNLISNGFTTELPRFECTMKMSRKFLDDVPNDKLKTLCEHYGFINHNAHRALSDTESCAYIYAKMMLKEFK